ncbi:Hsp70 family protein [Nonomuraea sp. NPDC049269]|uniref:Hsp70 family protein n=1 Tax=Nonomuraea sp. NPDC049269 TaxID=3364349 RepID=UPI0037172D5F
MFSVAVRDVWHRHHFEAKLVPVQSTPIRIFISYARADSSHASTFRTYAAALFCEPDVEAFQDVDIKPGQDWERVLLEQMDTADIVVLLITQEFVASEFCMRHELPRAMQRSRDGLCLLLPVNVAPFVPGRTPLAELQWVPSGPPITTSPGAQQAWIRAVKELAKQVRARRALDPAGSGGELELSVPVTVPLGTRIAHALSGLGLLDWLAGGATKRLLRAQANLEHAFADPLNVLSLDDAARVYRRSVRLALRLGRQTALDWVRSFDELIPLDCYELAFRTADEGWLAQVVRQGNRHSVAAVFELATRLSSRPLQLFARDRLAHLLATARAPEALTAQLRRWYELGLLDRRTLADSVRTHLTHTPLSTHERLWTDLLDDLPEALLPELFEVHCLLGRCQAAAPLADTRAKEASLLRRAVHVPRLSDVLATLRLPQRPEHVEMFRVLNEHAGDLYVAAGRDNEALQRYQEANRHDRVSECHERLGDVSRALATCPAVLPDRMARLAGACLPEVDARVERGELTVAAARTQDLLAHLERATEITAALSARRTEITGRRKAILATGRRYFGDLIQRQPAAATEHYKRWSRLEEAAGEIVPAAHRAEDGNEPVRAHTLYFQAGRNGDAERVLKNDDSPAGFSARAQAREAGGDVFGAARHYESAKQWERASSLYAQDGWYHDAARCLITALGEDAIEDPRVVDYLRRAGEFEQLVRLCRQAVDRTGGNTNAVAELRHLQKERSLSPRLKGKVDRTLKAVDGRARHVFEERAQSWVKQAKTEIDQRFADTWGLDLGTTTCVAAIYDTRIEAPVLCPSAGQDHFVSTLSIDTQGSELVGITGEHIASNRIQTHISGAKRHMGTDQSLPELGTGSYRPEEVAARLIQHARHLVETFLKGQVRERVGELARIELGEVRQEWLAWTEHHHDLRVNRPRVIVTTPAYFPLKANNATRDACVIAGVEAVRLIHEPTAACIATARERDLLGEVLVVDLGAGTLDLSLLEIEDGQDEDGQDIDKQTFHVQQVDGNHQYGGKDFDAAISHALRQRLHSDGVEISDEETRQRLDLAAEWLKISLSGQSEAEYELIGFAGYRNVVRLRLTRTELASILAQSFKVLREVCQEFAEKISHTPEHLVLVGGPMLSPLVSDLVEEIFEVERTRVANPRTAVAYGAALQGAVLDKKLKKAVLLDVTPFALGIATSSRGGEKEFTQLIERNSLIPSVRKKICTTYKDNQQNVHIQIFSGELDPKSRIGQFVLGDIPPAPHGIPKIEVTFSIDENCVLEVTARDLGTENARSVKISDTTMLSPEEIRQMTERHRQLARRRRQQAERDAYRAEIAELVDLDLGEETWREYSGRLATYRPAGAPHDDQTEQTLLEMFRTADQVEVELSLIQGPLRDLVALGRAYLQEDGGSDLERDLEQAAYLAAKLRNQADLLQPVAARVAEWNDLLAWIHPDDPERLRRFRAHHHKGEHRRAVDAISQRTARLNEPADIERYLCSLAEIGDTARYRSTLTANTALLGVSFLDPEDPEAFVRRMSSSLITVKVSHPGGGRALATGFLVRDQLVATNRRWLVDSDPPLPIDLARIQVAPYGRVSAVHLPPQAIDLALIELAEPVAAPLPRLGYSSTVRVGDRVWIAAPNPKAEAGWKLGFGTVDTFASSREHGFRLFKCGMQVKPRAYGGPLFNDLGEVVGVLMADHHQADKPLPATFALSVDAVDQLLAGHLD